MTAAQWEAVKALLTSPFVLLGLAIIVGTVIVVSIHERRAAKTRPVWWVGFAGPMTYAEATHYATLCGAPQGYVPERSEVAPVPEGDCC